jgi:hypothetical protein
VLQILAWRTPILKDYRYIVYHDSSLSVRNRHLYRDVMQHLQNNSYVHIAHLDRNTITAEAKASLGQQRYKDDHVEAQVEHYRRDWLFPDNVVLRMGTFAAYDMHDPGVQVLAQTHFKVSSNMCATCASTNCETNCGLHSA